MAKDIDLHPSEWSVEDEKFKATHEPILSQGWLLRLSFIIVVSALCRELYGFVRPIMHAIVHPIFVGLGLVNS